MNARVSRRSFIKLGAAGGAALFLPWRFGPAIARAQIPGPTLPPGSIPKYETPLLIPPAMPRAGKIKVKGGGKNIDYYEIAVRQFEQQILPAGLPATTVWGYGPRVAQGGPLIFNAPSLTIEAKHRHAGPGKLVERAPRRPGGPDVRVPPPPPAGRSDPPLGEPAGRRRRPRHAAGIHCDARPLHRPRPDRDPRPRLGRASATRATAMRRRGSCRRPATSRPATRREGTWYDFFRAKAAAKGYLAPGTTAWEPGTAVFQYPNSQRASTIWYHDHTLGMTRLNVYAGTRRVLPHPRRAWRRGHSTAAPAARRRCPGRRRRSAIRRG